MADLVTRLRLDDKEFNDNIRRSRREVENFKKSGDIGKQGITTLLTSFKGMAAGVTVASTAVAAFDTAVNSSASSQENLSQKLHTAKTSVNEFFNSIKSGDWSFFKDGIVEAIKLAGDYQKAMKAITKGTPLFNTYKDFKDAQLDRLNNKIENPNASKGDKEKAWREYKSIYQDQDSTVRQAERGLQENIKTVVSKAGITLKNNKDFENLFKANTATASGLVYNSDIYDRYKEIISEGLDKPIDEESFFKKEKELGYSSTYEGKHSDYAQKRINAQEELKAIEQYHPDVIMLYKLKEHLNEEELQAINESISTLSGVRSNFESRVTEYNDLSTKFDESGEWIGDDKNKVTSRTVDLEKKRKEVEEEKIRAEKEKEQVIKEGISQILQNRKEYNESKKNYQALLDKVAAQAPTYHNEMGEELFSMPQEYVDIESKAQQEQDLLDEELTNIIEKAFKLGAKKGSKNWYNEVIAALESAENNLTNSNDYQEIDKIVSKLTDERNEVFSPAQSHSLQSLEEWLRQIETKLRKTSSESPEFNELKDSYKYVKDLSEFEREKIYGSEKPEYEEGSITDIRKQLSINQDYLLTLNPELNKETIAETKKEIKQLQEELSAKEIELGIKMPEDLGKEALSAFEGSLSRVNSLVQMFSESWNDMSGFEQFIQSTTALISIIDTVSTLQTTWETLSRFLSIMSGKRTAETSAEASATTTAEASETTAVVAAEAAQTSAVLAGSATRTAALKAEMAAGSAAAYAYMPFVGVGLAAGQIAAFESMILAASAVPTFEDGGIFQSPLTSGDRNLARLNGGEMILNKGQQANLFNLLDGNYSSNGNNHIEFKLRGSDIYGSLTNYNKKYSKLR